MRLGKFFGELIGEGIVENRENPRETLFRTFIAGI